MVFLKNPKISAIHRELGIPRPVLRNKTRWSSSFDMIKRYAEMYDALDPRDPDLADVLPTAQDHRRIMETILPLMESLSVHTALLQSADLTLPDVRALFDSLIADDHSFVQYLSPTSAIVKDSLFESAVVKILDNRETDLTEAEKLVVAHLKLPAVIDEEAGMEGTAQPGGESVRPVQLLKDLKR
eukprot:TRINITY_DN6283_c0_g1_i2.p1 TRINITY_DN6283_c0_g1~~TRINITY_DN6283_c0_g1_i2.p1  ORF type:complete len:185 (+),score=52.94 TRINITY_DN6283_c0_g1_i2:231-785(+)